MTADEITAMLAELRVEFQKQVDALPFTKKTRGDIVAGFQDGARSAVNALKLRGVLVVK